MDRRFFIASLMAASVSATFVSAATFQDKIVQELLLQGYGDVFVQTTWLGRVHISATKGKDYREIVLNPRTGEVLRDIVLARHDPTEATSKSHSTTARDESSGNSASGNSASGNSASGNTSSSSSTGSNSSSSSENEQGKEQAEKERERAKEQAEKERERAKEKAENEKENDD